jgi:hypothetical protein
MLTAEQIAWLQRNKAMSGGRAASVPPATPLAAPASGGLPQPMQVDCRVVHNRVPGPENHLLCATHGHIVDTQSRTIIALDLQDYLKRGLGGHHQGDHYAPADRTAPAGTPPATPVHAAGPAGARPAAAVPAAQPVHTPPAASQPAPAQPASAQPGGGPPAATQPAPAAPARPTPAPSSTAGDRAQAGERPAAADPGHKQRNAMTTGAVGAIKDLRDTSADQINQITDETVKGPLAAELNTLNGLITALEQQKDPAKFADERDAADAAARALLKKSAEASPDQKKATSALRGAYQKALKERYGIELTGNQQTTAEHIDLEKVYETLESVPVGHAANTKMQKIGYAPRLRSGDHGIGLFTGTGMDLGDIEGTADNYRDPTHPNEKPKVPRLAITVLHELGHTVDARWGIMSGDVSKDSFGGWRSYPDVNAVAGELTAFYLRTGASGGASEKSLTEAIVAVINNRNAIAQPADMTDPKAWTSFHPFLKRCANLLSEDFGGRGYSFGSDSKWHSYSRAVRATTKVTDYQWTAPAEWFAELYAMTWYLKRDPPDVDPKVKMYLYSKKTGDTGPGAPGGGGQQGR